jgi:hypothetical protein
MHESDVPVRQEIAPAPRVEAPVHQELPRVEAPSLDAPRAEAPHHAVPQRMEAPRVETPRHEAPRVDSREILSSTGLQMVETDRSKARQVAPEPEPTQLGRPRRERPAVQAASDELVQVETRNK